MGVNKDQVKGRVDEAAGTIKEAAGKAVGNDRLQAEGIVQRTIGKARAKFGDFRKSLGK